MFHSARLKLTGWYLAIIFLIIAFFSMAIYSMLSEEVERFTQAHRKRIERHYRPEDSYWGQTEQNLGISLMDPELVEETKRRIALMLIVVDGVILLLAGGISYFLAGKTLRPIKDMMDDQNRFIADASHELRTPLTALKSAMEVHLRDKKLTLVQARELIDQSINEVNKLQGFSDGLLQLIQYQTPNGRVPAKEFDLKEVAGEVIRSMKSVAAQKNVGIVGELQSTRIVGYHHSISDLLRILLDNAIKYSLPNSTVTIRTNDTDGMVTVEIKDTGIGIETRDLPHIFDRFYRADTARTKNNISGYGLGLSIAMQIVQMHHGTISVASHPQKSTTFTIRLPKKHRPRPLRLFR